MAPSRRFDIFGAGIYAKSRKVTAQRRVNVYYQFEEQEEDTTKVSIFGAPGLELFSNGAGDTAWRGLIAPEKQSVMYGVHRDRFFEINTLGNLTQRGTLESAVGRCYLADNGSQVMLVDPDDSGKGYVYTPSGPSFAKITNVNYPGLGNVDFINGYFVGPKLNSGRWYKSASFDGLTWAALDFANAETSPDNSQFTVVQNKLVTVLSDNSTEFFNDAGVSGMPFVPVQGVSLPWGVASNASVARTGDGVIVLMRNKEGQPRLMKISGYQAVRLSPDSWEQVVQRYSDYADATAFAFMMDGHLFYQINFPSAGKSWLYDDNTKLFFERESSGGRHRCNEAVAFNRQIIASDYSNGNLYKIKPDTYTDNGAEIRRLLVSKHVFDANVPLTVNELEFLFDVGVGLASGQGSDPVIMLRCSKDGGNTYLPERRAKLGKIGEYSARVKFDQFGQGNDFVFEISMTDPVKFALVGERIRLTRDERVPRAA